MISEKLIFSICIALTGLGVSANAAEGRYHTPPNHRISETINRDWTFNYFPAADADSNGCQTVDFDDSAWPAIAIPHTWMTYETTGKLHPFNHDAHEKDDSYWWYGWGWYRKHFSINPEESGRRVFVVFDGVQKICDVWINGHFVGKHLGGYTGFYFDITDWIHFGGDNVLAVAVNARQDDPIGIPPMSAGNWNTYGGIYRDVHIVIKDPLHIPFQGSYKQEGGTFVTTPEVSDNSGTVDVKTWVRNDNSTAQECELRTTIADADSNIVQVLTQMQTVQSGELAEFDQVSTAIPHPHLWSPDSPYVYHVFSDIYHGGVAVDHFESPLGFRWFHWDYQANRLILNGKKVIIHGTNHHQEWPWLGDATPLWLQLLDMRDIRYGLNDNFMRTCHYPNDPAIYNFNDHNGIITIEEQPNDKRQEFSDVVQEQMLRETIRRDRNHPSIFFWSMGNETDDAVNSKYAVAEDTNRIIYARQIYNDTAGQFVTLTDKQLPIEDLLRCTIRGWYNSDDRDLEPKSCQQAGNEEWQHDQAVAYFIKHNQGRAADDLANLCTWIYEDHGCDRKYANCPLNFINPKGWVDSWRVPKYMYYLWEAWYSPQPIVYIHPDSWRPQYLGQKREIVVDSNCQTVELQVNGREIGVLQPSLSDANVVRFEHVPVESGVLTAIGRRGTDTVTNSVFLAGPPAHLTLSVITRQGWQPNPAVPRTYNLNFAPSQESAELETAQNSIAIVRADIVDANGHHVQGATNTIYWSVSGPATLVGAPVYETDTAKNQADSGTMYICAPTLNLIRSSGQPGQIIARVMSPGLTSAQVTLTATNPPSDSSTAIVQQPLSAVGRHAVAHEPGASRWHETAFQEIQPISADLLWKGKSVVDYSRQMDRFLRKSDPHAAFNSPEYRAVLFVFARLLEHNRGRLVRDDFNFIAGLYNNCRQITRQIDELKLPELFKNSLHEYYARTMITLGKAKDFETETSWLQSLPDGRLVMADAPSSIARKPDIIYTDKPDLSTMVALAMPEFKKSNAVRKAAILRAVCAINPNVRCEISKSGGEKVHGVRQKTVVTVTYEVAKDSPILIPNEHDLASINQSARNEGQN